MSAQTPVYLYNQRQWVVLLQATANATRRYEKVYAKELVINKGVDNLIEFAFINQEQKPVNISGKDITCRILNYKGNELLLQKTLVPLLPVTGITSLQLTVADIQNIDAQNCYYSLEIPVGSFDYPVFVDANGGARGTIRIVNSVLPDFQNSHEITIPTHPRPQAGLPRNYYSSVFYTNESSLFTFQRWLDNFTGTVQFEASTVMDFSTFYTISPVFNYNAYTGTEMWNVEGYHPFIRVHILNNGSYPAIPYTTDLSGDVTRILVRS